MRKVQISLTEESWNLLEAITKEANEDFELGSISYSDVMSEAILQSRIDLKALQAKHANVRKSLRLLASKKDIDIDTAIKNLMELKQRNTKKHKVASTNADGVARD